MTTDLAIKADPKAIQRRLAASSRLRKRRFELLPLTGPGAVFTEIQGRAPGDATSDEGLQELISSIAQVGVLQPILVEELPHGAHRLVAGERRLLACRRGQQQDPENPHFQAIPAVLCPGPLAADERTTWQLIENLAREDLQPGELAAALIFERCAVLSVRLEESGVEIPTDVIAEDDPVEKWKALNKFKATTDKKDVVFAPWPHVIQRLGLRLSEEKVVQVVRAFSQMPPELSEEMDADQVRLAARLTYLKLAKTKEDAANELWAAVKEKGRPRLLSAAARELLEHPQLSPERALERAEQLDNEANEARRTALLKTGVGSASEAPPVTSEVLDAAIDALAALLGELRAGAVIATYDSGSIRLYVDELGAHLAKAEEAITQPLGGAA